MALRHRDATGGRGKGQGQLVDVALYEAVFNLMESTLPEYDVFGAVRTRTGGSLPGIVPSNTYECADGAAIVVAGNGDAIFRRLMTAIGRDDLANDPALARNEGRAKRVEEIDGAIQAWCRQRPIDEALAHLTAADVPVSRIYSVADMAGDPQFQARRMFEQAVLPDGTPMKVPAIVPKLSATPGETRWIGPRLGEHTDDVLRGLGYDDAAISALREEGVI
jgi:formyl-CoA transferase